MAKILFVVPVGQDMGGIITSTEQYVKGMQEAGHTVTPICAVFTAGDAPIGSAPRGKFADDYRPGEGTYWPLHPTGGWRSEDRISLACEAGLDRFVKLAKAYDLVVWACLYSLRNEATEGRSDWLRAIKAAKGRNVFMVHDDHMPARYPWAFGLAKYAAGFVGVQPCSYDSLEGVTAPRSMVYTPIRKPPAKILPYDQRAGYLSCQIWKPWKRADALVAAAPHMPKNSVWFAGDGIQLRYMRSPDKCPPRYEGLWDAAMKKQKYMGVLSEADRDEEMRRCKYIVDLSLRHNSGQLNRVVQEAMAQGCVVIANPKFITGTRSKPLFIPGVHYLPIDETFYDKPKALADRLLGLDKDNCWRRYADIQKQARKVLGLFDREKLGAELIEFGLANIGAGKSASSDHQNAFAAMFGAKP